MIIWGGVQATLNPEKCISHCDVVCRGEGEKIISKICNGERLDKIGGIYYKKNGKIFKNEINYLVEEDLDKIPFPDNSYENWFIFENGKIIPLKKRDDKTSYIILTSRGCPFNCTYCSNNSLRKIYNGKYVRRRSVENVIKELEEAKRIHPNLRSIGFWDDVFSLDLEWIKEFSKEYKNKINLPFKCMVHPKFCTKEVIGELKSMGLQSVDMGIQTFSQKIKKLYNRPETNEEIFRSLKILNKYDIEVFIDLIQGNPLEAEEDMKINLNCLLKMNPKFKINTYSLSYFPNTELTNNFLKKGIIKKEDVEDEIDTNTSRGTFIEDKNKGIAILYHSLYYLAQQPLRNKWLIRKLQQNKYLRKNPEKLKKFLRFFAGRYYPLNWNSKLDRGKFYVYQGIKLIRKKGLRYLIIKLKNRI